MTKAGSGTLALSGSAAIGTGNLTLNNGGVLGLGTGNFTRGIGTIAGAFQMSSSSGGGGFAAYGANRNVSPGTLTWGGTVETNIVGTLLLSAADSDFATTWTSNISFGGSARTIQVANGSAAIDAVFSGVFVSNPGALTKTGTGTLALTNTNLYTGATLVSVGTLMLGNGAGNTGNINTASSITVSSGATLAINRNGASTQAGNFNVVLSGAGSFAQVGTGTTTLSLANSYTGTTRVNAGGLSINTIANVNGGSTAIGAPTTAANGLITLGSADTTGTLIYTGALQSTDRTIQIGTNSATPAVTDTGGATIQADGASDAPSPSTPPPSTPGPTRSPAWVPCAR